MYISQKIIKIIQFIIAFGLIAYIFQRININAALSHAFQADLVFLMLGVFTLASLQMGVTFILYYREQSGLVREFFARDALHWHGANQFGEPLFNMLWAIYITTIVGGYIASLIFFFHQRHQGLKTS